MPQRLIPALVLDLRLVRHRGRRGRHPAAHFRVFRHDLRAEKRYCAEIFGGARVDQRRHEPGGGIAHHDQLGSVERQRAEKPYVRIADRLEIPGLDFVAEDIRDAREIAAAIKVAAVLREHETLRDRRAHLEGMKRRRVTFADRLGAHDPDLRHLRRSRLRARVGDRHRRERAVGREVEVEGRLARREHIQRLPLFVGVRDAHQHHEPVVESQAPQGAIGGIKDQVADPDLLEQRPRLAGADIQGFQIAVAAVVRRVKQRLGPGIVGERGHRIAACTLDLVERGHRAIPPVNRHEMRQLPRVLHAHIQMSSVRGDVAARYGTEILMREVVDIRKRMLAHGPQVLLLEAMLPVDPLVPGLIQRQAKYPLKIIGVIAPAVGLAPPPVEQALRPVVKRQVVHEARPVQVSVGASPEIDLGAFRNQAERVIEFRLVAHHRPKRHFVVTALGAAHSPAHPRLHEYCAALLVPPRSGVARHGKVVVEQGLGMRRVDVDLAVKQPPVTCVGWARAIGHGEVGGLVERGPPEPVAR